MGGRGGCISDVNGHRVISLSWIAEWSFGTILTNSLSIASEVGKRRYTFLRCGLVALSADFC